MLRKVLLAASIAGALTLATMPAEPVAMEAPAQTCGCGTPWECEGDEPGPDDCRPDEHDGEECEGAAFPEDMDAVPRVFDRAHWRQA